MAAAPQVMMAPQPQVMMAPQQQQVVVTSTGGGQNYCGPISWAIGCFLFWFFIGPFAVFVFLCPCDQQPMNIITTTQVRAGAPETGDECEA